MKRLSRFLLLVLTASAVLMLYSNRVLGAAPSPCYCPGAMCENNCTDPPYQGCTFDGMSCDWCQGPIQFYCSDGAPAYYLLWSWASCSGEDYYECYTY